MGTLACHKSVGFFFFFCETEWTGSVSPCLSFSCVVLPSSVFFSEPSDQFPSTARVTWDYGSAGCRCRRKTVAEASEKKHSVRGLQVKEADFAAMFRNVRSHVWIARWEPPDTTLQRHERIFGNSCVDFEALTLVDSTGRK